MGKNPCVFGLIIEFLYRRDEMVEAPSSPLGWCLIEFIEDELTDVIR
jgi:hypothetical protein